MAEGREYVSLVDVAPAPEMNFRDEIRRAVSEVEGVRNRPLICYMGNVVRSLEAPASINRSDDLPFSEMVASVPNSATSIDIAIVTPGGLVQQVSHFVNRMRPRFNDVSFLIPHMAMSAGTIWALSGNEIWMDERAFLGPIDPQVPSRDGRLVPAQAILTLLRDIQQAGEERLKNGQNPPWSMIRLLDNMDAKEIGDALAQSQYSIQLAADYLENHKFRDWLSHSDGRVVTRDEKSARAREVATKLCSHEDWKVHSHGISRDVAWNKLKIRIGEPETVPALHRTMRRLWALMYWLFENTAVSKVFISTHYALFRTHVGGDQ
jgi:hypothetical protein